MCTIDNYCYYKIRSAPRRREENYKEFEGLWILFVKTKTNNKEKKKKNINEAKLLP